MLCHHAASIPPYATGPAIILVGALMMVNIVKIRWNNVNEAVPAFLTMIVMPMTYSIAYGKFLAWAPGSNQTAVPTRSILICND